MTQGSGRSKNSKAFSHDNYMKTLKRMLYPRHIPILTTINNAINQLKLKRVGLTNLLTWADKITQGKYILFKMEQANKTAITDQDIEEWYGGGRL